MFLKLLERLKQSNTFKVAFGEALIGGILLMVSHGEGTGFYAGVAFIGTGILNAIQREVSLKKEENKNQ